MTLSKFVLYASISIIGAAPLIIAQQSSAQNADQLPATKHQAEALKGVHEADSSTPSTENGMPVTPHQHEVLEAPGNDGPKTTEPNREAMDKDHR